MSVEARPGDKQTEVGVIPEDWEVNQLDTLGVGSVPPIKAGPFGSSLTKDTYVASGFKVYGQEQVIRGDYLFGDYFISLKKYRELESCAVHPGDVLLSLVGTAGKLLVVPIDAPAGVINPRLIRFSFDKKRVSPLFFKDLFEAGQVQSLLARYAQGGTMGVLNAGMLRMVNSPLPSLAEQEAIAEALSDADTLIESLEQLVAKKRHLKQGTMQELLTGKKRLSGFSGDWEVKRLGDVVAQFVGGGTPSRSNPAYWGEEIPWVTVKDFATFNPRSSQESITRTGLHNSASHLIPRGTLITSTRMALGKAVIYEVDVAINQDLKALFLKSILDTRYLCFWFQYHGQSINDLGSGSTVKGISLPDLRKIEFQLPSVSEQTAIATILSDMDTEIAELETQLTKTRALKQGMMHKLLTGEIRLI